jgi:glycosyltransferase involved in cell wall biosynthesis
LNPTSRILLVQRHYWPEVGAPALQARRVAERLQKEGHRVTVLSSFPGYNSAYEGPRPAAAEVVDGVEVIRVRLPREWKGALLVRALDAFPFPLGVIFHLLTRWGKYDLIITSTAPPVLLAAAVRLVSQITRSRYVYHLQDLNPEAALLAGLVTEDWKTRLLARLDYRSCRDAAALVILSKDMRATLSGRGIDVSDVRVINNFVTFEIAENTEVPTGLGKPPGRFRVLFAGNLGLVQDLETVIKAAHSLRDREAIEFVFVGGGALAPALQQQAGDLVGRSVYFYPYQPLSTTLRLMADADLGLVSLSPGIHRVAFPSKTMAYLAAGCPILVVADPDSELAAFPESTGTGRSCRPENPDELAAAIAAEHDSGAGRDREHIHRVAREYFGEERALGAWAELVDELTAQPFDGRRGVPQ